LERVRQRQRAEWQAAAPGWVRRRDAALAAGQGIPEDRATRRLIELARIGPGMRVLDLACGLGNPTFRIAGVVGPEGQALGLDLTAPLVEEASAWARSHQVANAAFRHIESELQLGVAPESFDAATCRFGLMFMPAPVAALRAIHDALKPGARLAVSVWGPVERIPNFQIALDAIKRHATPPPDEATLATLTGPMRLSDRERLASYFQAAGFTEVESEIVEVATLAAATPESYWELMSASAGPMVPFLAAQPENVRAAIRADAIAMIAARVPSGPVALPGEAIVIAGTKPA
jgi:ubiquinone/menaquinone biosynthesis C-methylase UbiE